MIEQFTEIEIYGMNFRPSDLEAIFGSIFSDKIDAGDTGRKGRYKDLVMPYGCASIKALNDIPGDKAILWLLNFVKDKVELIREKGGGEIILRVVYKHKGQCNCEITMEEIDLLYHLRIPLVFSVYEDSDRN